MLEHSLQDNPSNQWRGTNSRIANLIRNDSSYLNALEKVIENSNDQEIDTYIDVAFDDDDLYYSIHRATIHIYGYKKVMENGRFTLN